MKLIERFLRRATPPVQHVEPGAAPLLMALEPRIMFDASVGVVAQDAAQATTEPTADSTSKESTAKDTAAADTRSTQGSQSTATSERHEVVFVDGQVGNVQQLIAGLSSNAEIVVLDPSKDGLQQMADYLKGREGLDAVHLLSHGADGTVQVGNVWLSSSNLAEHSAALESIGAALKADGDLMIYGCRVGESSTGQAFIDQLAAITGADVAASADDTGAASLGGNWTLESHSGAIETTALDVESYEGVLVSSWSTGSAPLGSTLITAGGRTVVGDFDGDGDTDILYQTGANGSAWAYARSNGDGTFTQLTQAQSPFAGVALLDSTGSNYFVGDFDGDGDVDILIGVNNSVPTYLRNDGGTFVQASTTGLPTIGAAGRMVVGDFDGDGDADILYQTGTNGTALAYIRSDGNGNFTQLALNQSPFAGLTLPDMSGTNYFVADFDGDGDVDVLATVSGSTGFYLRNNGNGTFSSMSTSGFPNPSAAGRVVVGDFDGDGNADILYQTAGNTSAFQYAKSNGDGTFTIMSLASSPLAGLSLVDHTGTNYRVGDFDGDGDLDIVAFTNGTAGNLYLQNGAAPRLVSTTPADNTLNVSPTANITLTFSESVTKGTGTIQIVRTSDNVVVETIAIGSSQITGSGTTWTIDPSITLAGGVSYAVRITPKAFVDADSTVFKGISNNTTLNFTTATLQPPVIGNLNGDSVSYTEKAAYALLDDGANATVSDADSSNFGGGKLTAQISAGGTAGEDVLFIRDQGAGANQITLSGSSILYNGLVLGTFTGGSNGNPLVITFNSNANATTVAALVHNLAYRNANTTDPSTTARSVSISMDDGTGGSSTVSVVSLAVLAVNDAPVVNVTATNPTYTENGSAVQLFNGAVINTVESGQKVSQMTFTVSGVANGSAEKLVIDGSDVTLTNGTNVVTSNNGLTVTVSVTSGTANVTLSSSAGLDVATAQTVLNAMAYRNDSDSPNTANRVVTLSTVSDNGGSANGGTPTSSVGIFSTVTVVGVNDAPVLAGAPYSLPSITEDTTSAGVRISTLLTNYTMVDADVGALRGIAVTAKSGNGTWQYSTDNATWTDFGAVAGTSALLLASTTYVRYVPDGANGETASLTFRGWDQTNGSASVNGIRGVADASINGGSTAFSSATAVANQPVTSVNDAPVMTPVAPTLTGLTDGSTSNAGQLVSSLLGGVTDVDSGALQGAAITGLTSTYGVWQYSIDGGASWSNVGTVSVATALILRSSDAIRFVPDGTHGETATITYKAWDQTGGSSGSQGTKVDTSTAGGTTAYSVSTDTASVVVTAVNDAPVVTVTGTPVSWTEGNNVTSTPIVVDPGLTVSDSDGPNPLSATARMLTYYSSQDTLSFVNDGLTMGNIVGTWTAGNGTLTLTSAGNQATVAQFEAALRAITYNNSSNSPNSTTRTVQFIVTDGSNAASAAVTRDITITAVNDSPTISAPASLPISEDTLTALSQITVSDVDSTLGTVTFSVGSGNLSAVGAGGVTVGGTSTALTLSGTLANINLFIANNRLTYTPAANASGDVTLTINVNTSSVSDATTTVTLQVAAVNDAPVATVPSSITVTEDVSSVITGVSFSDVDAGANTVTATFSVPSGTLSASSALGVTVGGSNSDVLTLSGSLADINTFIAANRLTFKTAQDATFNVTLTVSINDGGFSGSGGEQTDTKTITLNVTAVNDAPVNNVPGAQTAQQNVALGFNTANGNAISITDVDAGNGLMTVTLTATNGLLTLGSMTGVTMILGTGVNNPSMMFEGSRANLNAALQTLSFRSASNFLGSASLTIETNDNGNTGSGGAKTDTDVISITVIPLNPRVTGVSASTANGTYKTGDTITLTVTFDQAVTVDTSGGTPNLLLETGLIDRVADYAGGSGSTTLTFTYTVQAGDISADLDFQSTAALQLNGAVVANNTNDLAILTLPTPGSADSLGGQKNIVVDGVAPVITSVSPPSNGTYIAGQNLDFTVNFSENVVVDSTGGVPRVAVTLDTGGTVYADYVSGSGGNALVFRLTVANGQLDTTGVTLASSVQLNGGSIRDTAGNDTIVTLNGVGSTANVNVDAVAPTVASVGLPAAGAYNAGDVLTFTVNASENVIVDTSTGTPRIALNLGGVTRYASYVSGSGSNVLVFEYVVQASNNASTVTLGANIDINGGTLRDAAGNNMNLALNATGSNGIVIDNAAPEVGNIVNVDITPTNASSVRYTVTFTEDVSGVDASDFSLTFTGSASGRIASIERVNGRTYTLLVDSLTGAGNVRLDLNGSNTGIVDAAGNPLAGGLEGSNYTIDRVAPSVSSVVVPASGTYVAGQTLDFVVNTDERVVIDSNNGNPRLAITLDNGRVVYADYISNSSGTALLFRLSVTNGMSGNSTFAVAPSIDLNGGSIRDVQGNDANTGLNNLGDTSGILVDAKAPTPTSIVVNGPVLATDRTLSFTLTFDEAVSGVDASDFSVLGTSSASGTVQSVQQVDARTYRIVVGDLRGQGALALSLNAQNSGIQDGVGNALTQSLVGQTQSLQSQDVGDLAFRLNPPPTSGVPSFNMAPPGGPAFAPVNGVSPMAMPPLFDVRSVGADFRPLGTIFLGNGSSAPSFIAQVFSSSDSGLVGAAGNLGAARSEGGVFGTSTLSAVFSREVPGVSEMNVFNGSQWKQSDLNQGLRGVFGAPTFGQQLQQINEADQRHIRALAKALAQPTEIGKRA